MTSMKKYIYFLLFLLLIFDILYYIISFIRYRHRKQVEREAKKRKRKRKVDAEKGDSEKR